MLLSKLSYSTLMLYQWYRLTMVYHHQPYFYHHHHFKTVVYNKLYSTVFIRLVSKCTSKSSKWIVPSLLISSLLLIIGHKLVWLNLPTIFIQSSNLFPTLCNYIHKTLYGVHNLNSNLSSSLHRPLSLLFFCSSNLLEISPLLGNTPNYISLLQ